MAVREEGNRRGGEIDHNAGVPHFIFKATNLKRTLRTALESYCIPRQTQFTSLSPAPPLPTLSYPSNLQFPVSPPSQPVFLFLISLRRETLISQLAGISTSIGYLLSCHILCILISNGSLFSWALISSLFKEYALAIVPPFSYIIFVPLPSITSAANIYQFP